jgi:hypothetical protein
MKNRLLTTLWAFAVIALLVAVPAAAQLTSADILGKSPMPQAPSYQRKVTVVNLATSLSEPCRPAVSGEYVFNLPSGQYSVTVAPSFRNRYQCDVGLQRSRPRRRRAAIGETNQVVG